MGMSIFGTGSGYIDFDVCNQCEFFVRLDETRPNWVKYKCKARGNTAVEPVERGNTVRECPDRDTVRRVDADTKAAWASGGLGGYVAAKAGNAVKKSVALDVNYAKSKLDDSGLGFVNDAASGLGKLAGKGIQKAKEASARAEAERAQREAQKAAMAQVIKNFASQRASAIKSIVLEKDSDAVFRQIGELRGMLDGVDDLADIFENSGGNNPGRIDFKGGLGGIGNLGGPGGPGGLGGIRPAARDGIGFDPVEKAEMFKPVTDAIHEKIRTAIDAFRNNGVPESILADYMLINLIGSPSAGEKNRIEISVLEKLKAKYLSEIGAVDLTGGMVAVSAAIILLFEISEIVKAAISNKDTFGSNKNKVEVLGPVCGKALEKIETGIDKLREFGPAGNVYADVFKGQLETEKKSTAFKVAGGKRWVILLILSIVLGLLGVDRFFVRKIGTGFLKLITLGGFGIWWLIDIIIILAGKFKDADGNVIGRPGSY
jgi:TM2 domain-containing membrane protein YozV